MQKPTKVYESELNGEAESYNKKKKANEIISPKIKRPALAPLRITKETIVIDARSAFSYSMAHIRRSINLQWQDFTKRGSLRGVLEEDLFSHARRLARLGIAEDSEVIVVDNGFEDNGVAGRIAWTLFYMGVSKVQYSSIKVFNAGWTNTKTEKPYPSLTIWKPKLERSVTTTRSQFEKLLKTKAPKYFSHADSNVSHSKLIAAASDVRVIDVREPQEYQKSTFSFGAINISWKEFLNTDGRPEKRVVEKLKSVGIYQHQKIILISNQGVRSAAVTMALLDLGFLSASNYAGGYLELQASN